MNALELTQRQRELLENIAKAAHQYRQAAPEASSRLERELKQIEQSRDEEHQRIEEERKEKTKITYETPPKDKSEQKKREEREQRLQQAVAARKSTTTPPTGITTIEAVKGEINRALSLKISAVGGCILTIITVIILFGCCAALLIGINEGRGDIVVASLVAFIVSFIITSVLNRRETKMEESFLVKKITLLHHLYDRWLELVDERASAQRAEAQRRYEQAVAQAKGQIVAVAEQWRPAIAEFGALTEQVSPSWESEAWRRWEPGSLGPGAVRLGVFTKTEV